MAKAQHAASYRGFPAMLRRMREEAQFTQRDLAKRLRRSQPWVHKTEIGERRADITEFLDWCIACKVDPEQAFHELCRNRSRRP
ncbi:MAG: helix-turn-helix transcriptional regulator [Planctomycetes bacterium]|nr:helix-turn-helix transcriptional regulator [Planctomycetota bacterium]